MGQGKLVQKCSFMKGGSTFGAKEDKMDIYWIYSITLLGKLKMVIN